MCKPSEVKNNTGKLCYRWCKKYKFLGHRKTNRCKEWGLQVENLSNPDVFNRFLGAGFRVNVPR